MTDDGVLLFRLLPKDILCWFLKNYLTPMDQLLLRRTCKYWQQLIPVEQLKVTPGDVYWTMDKACEICNPILFDYTIEEYSMFSMMNDGFSAEDADYVVMDICEKDSLEMLCSLQKHFEYDRCLHYVFNALYMGRALVEFYQRCNST
jgi:hypothetical protein